MLLGALGFFLAERGLALAHERDWISLAASDGQGHGPDQGSKEWRNAIYRRIDTYSWSVALLTAVGVFTGKLANEREE